MPKVIATKPSTSHTKSQKSSSTSSTSKSTTSSKTTSVSHPKPAPPPKVDTFVKSTPTPKVTYDPPKPKPNKKADAKELQAAIDKRVEHPTRPQIVKDFIADTFLRDIVQKTSDVLEFTQALISGEKPKYKEIPPHAEAEATRKYFRDVAAENLDMTSKQAEVIDALGPKVPTAYTKLEVEIHRLEAELAEE